MYDFDESRMNLEYSHEPMKKGVSKDSDGGIEYSGGKDAVNDKSGEDMRSNSSVRNDEIQESEIKNEKISKNPIVLSAMLWISNSVTVLFFSMFITLVMTKNAKWFYIILSVFIVTTFFDIIKIILMRYDVPFLYRPGACIRDDNLSDQLFYRNFIMERIYNKIDMIKFSKRGLPSIHMVMSTCIVTMIYLFFPKYRKLVVKVAPIYIILVAYSRMYLNCHFIYQVIVGIILGMLGGTFMYNLFK
jgi:membrane-associated phospholipid phosphatase